MKPRTQLEKKKIHKKSGYTPNVNHSTNQSVFPVQLFHNRSPIQIKCVYVFFLVVFCGVEVRPSIAKKEEIVEVREGNIRNKENNICKHPMRVQSKPKKYRKQKKKKKRERYL